MQIQPAEMPVKTMPMETIQMLLTALVDAGLRPELYSSSDGETGGYVEWEIDCAWVGIDYDQNMWLRLFMGEEYNLPCEYFTYQPQARIDHLMEVIAFFMVIHKRHHGEDS